MNKPILTGTVAMAAACLLMNSCATARFYSDESLKTEIGLRCYSPKPYLLVEHTGGTQSIKTSLVYLPDLAKPQFVRFKPGLGSAGLKLELTNGMLTAYGLSADSQIPDLLGELADLVLKSTTAVGDAVRGKALLQGEPGFELFEIVMANGETRLVRVE